MLDGFERHFGKTMTRAATFKTKWEVSQLRFAAGVSGLVLP
jgi:hypothetical protein